MDGRAPKEARHDVKEVNSPANGYTSHEEPFCYRQNNQTAN